MNRNIPWICGLGLLLLEPIFAQTASPPDLKATSRHAWVMAASIPKDVPNPLPVLAGDNLHEARLHLRSIGQGIPLEAPLDEAETIHAVKSETDENGKVIYRNLSTCEVPVGVREALIILVPNDNNEGLKFNSKVIDLSKFKKGGCLYINLVKTKIGITIGEHKTVVESGGMEFINPLEGQEKSGVYPVRFFYEVPKEPDAEWKLMTSSKMAIYDSRREICVFFYNKEIENVDFRGIPFMTPSPPMPQKP